MHEFDEDTEVREVAPGVYEGRISGRWNIGPPESGDPVPNGGYVLAVGMSALRRALSCPDPLSVTAHYMRRAVPGPVSVHVETVKPGRSYSTAMARVVQGESEQVRILATYGDLGVGAGPTHIAGEPPALPSRDALVGERPADLPEIAHRFDIRSATIGFTPGRSSDRAEVSGWLRFADGRMPDVHALGLIADAFPPPAFHVIEPGWVPTLALTVHVRARPASQWLRCVFRTRFIFGGLLEEDGEIWDEPGGLVALSRQLAAAPR